MPWRPILGRHIVRAIGTERLSQLPAEQAIDHGNRFWTIQTSIDPAESITAQGRRAEREMIEILGEAFFAITERDELAKVKPAFPLELVPDDARLLARYGERLNSLERSQLQ